jgi:hypothetical protein
MTPPKIDRWAVIVTPGRGMFDGGSAIAGNVYGHPDTRHPDGKGIVTSRVVSFEGRVVTTRSGSRYRLGRIEPKYRRWLRKARPDWDWRQPLRVIKKPADVARFKRERAPLIAAEALEVYLKAGAKPAAEA